MDGQQQERYPMTFDEFCSIGDIVNSEKEAFRSFLGSEANEIKTHNEWLRLFNQFLKS